MATVWRRLAPRGVVTSSKEPLVGGTSGVAKSVAAEEHRCGLLCKVSSLATTSTLHQNRSAHGLVKQHQRAITCVIKAQSSDFQLNEVDANGDIAFLQRVPKARWQKVDKNQTFLIEDDSTEHFDNPGKSFSPRTMNYGKYVRKMGNVPERAPLLHFNVFRDNHSLSAVTNRLNYETKIQSDAIGFSSSVGGSFGCITQQGTAVGVSGELLPHASRHYNIHPLVFDPRRMHPLEDLPKLHRPHRGNFFRVLLRCVHGTPESIEDALQRLASDGFVNYFDVSRFTIASNHTHEIAALAATGDYFRAVSYATQALAERMPFHSTHFSAYLNASDKQSATVALAAWATSAKKHKLDGPNVRFLQALSSVRDFSADSQELRDVWMLHPHAVSMEFSGAEFVWNAMVSQRLLNHGMRVVVGDLVHVDAQGNPISASGDEFPTYLASMRPGNESSVRLVVSEEDALRFRMSDVVLPTPYPCVTSQGPKKLFPTVRGASRDDFVQFAASHRLGYLFEHNEDRVDVDGWHQQQRRVANHEYRSVVVKPERLLFRTIRDPNSFTSLKSDLFMMQERLPLHMVSELDERRIREPSTFNVSEAFAERMVNLRKDNRFIGDQSVVVTGFLPRGTDVPVMLREAFDVRHATFSDLLEPTW